MAELSAEDIIETIVKVPELTPVRIDLAGNRLNELDFLEAAEAFANTETAVIYGDLKDIRPILEQNHVQIYHMQVELQARNSGVPMLNYADVPARIEPGSINRDQVVIVKNAVIMMGAVLGGRAIVGNHAHIGANAVLAGVVEQTSANPVRIWQ
ncbi:tetrahydrodipicolinate N-succinyltransferase [Weissella uvarum]|nr:hypothetical protein [Weissella uvarum]MBM7616973.1 tetrahydrodipicolinate N-succinyltransferase [Weissella uvarum]